jgi:hypothetical protein
VDDGIDVILAALESGVRLIDTALASCRGPARKLLALTPESRQRRAPLARCAAELPSDRPQPRRVRYTIQTVIASTIVPTDSTTIVVGTSW